MHDLHHHVLTDAENTDR
jgi:hypothetical protein